MTEFKVGDKVKIVADTRLGHLFPIGTEVEIVEFDEFGADQYLVTTDPKVRTWEGVLYGGPPVCRNVCGEDIAPMEEYVDVTTLKAGDIVEAEILVVGNKWCKISGEIWMDDGDSRLGTTFLTFFGDPENDVRVLSVERAPIPLPNKPNSLIKNVKAFYGTAYHPLARRNNFGCWDVYNKDGARVHTGVRDGEIKEWEPYTSE